MRGRAVGRRPLEQLAGLVTPDTILRWYREIVAKKYDGASQRQDGRPSTAASLQRLDGRGPLDASGLQGLVDGDRQR